MGSTWCEGSYFMVKVEPISCMGGAACVGGADQLCEWRCWCGWS